MEKYMIEIENVTKRYILGQIGGTTLHEEIQRRIAKKRGKEDPTKKIGAKSYADGEEFWALSGVSFKVKKGERVGIIGHNGAGKSTLLKLLSRVTAPTSGEIGLDGRVTSMLEVGTGFHPELTGRENVYMNGAILGMTKKEIDAKMDEIIEFSECGQFIDTPVKRYSSGMYVKLAFSVAAHLDSEIMIMDEVLAVGDMAFQKKCLDKMNDVSRSEGRTILYVSHNMNTIRQLCDRVVVLDHGKVVFDGDVEDGISMYLPLSKKEEDNKMYFSYEKQERELWLPEEVSLRIKSLEIIGKENRMYCSNEKIHCVVSLNSFRKLSNIGIRFEFNTLGGTRCGANVMSYRQLFDLKESQDFDMDFEMSIKPLCDGTYYATVVAYRCNEFGYNEDLDCIRYAFDFTVTNPKNEFLWNSPKLGSIRFDDIEVK